MHGSSHPTNAGLRRLRLRGRGLARRATRALPALLLCASAQAAQILDEWNFEVTLDGQPIGLHRFDLNASGGERTLVSEAHFAVRLLGITAYRYDHKSTEEWRGDCLVAMAARTDDDGRKLQVQAQESAAGLKVSTGAGEQSLSGCVMSFAYWNPAMLRMNVLLNAQTGVAEKVRVDRIEDASIDVHGRPILATRWRISGAAAPIDVWYGADGRWVGLDSKLAGGKLLRYRLKPLPPP